MTALFKKIEKEAKKYFAGTNGCHDWDHTARVLALARHIDKVEKADLEIVELATILHDIGRPEQLRTKGLICHAEYGAKLARDILSRYDISAEKIERIAHCIPGESIIR